MSEKSVLIKVMLAFEEALMQFIRENPPICNLVFNAWQEGGIQVSHWLNNFIFFRRHKLYPGILRFPLPTKKMRNAHMAKKSHFSILRKMKKKYILMLLICLIFQFRYSSLIDKWDALKRNDISELATNL